MQRFRRPFSAFSLSFLDIMSCGFGAAILLFLIIKHNIESNVPTPVTTPDLSSEVMLLEEEILDDNKNLAKIRNTISDIDDELAIARGLARRIMDEIATTEGLTDELTTRFVVAHSGARGYHPPIESIRPPRVLSPQPLIRAGGQDERGRR